MPRTPLQQRPPPGQEPWRRITGCRGGSARGPAIAPRGPSPHLRYAPQRRSLAPAAAGSSGEELAVQVAQPLRATHVDDADRDLPRFGGGQGGLQAVLQFLGGSRGGAGGRGWGALPADPAKPEYKVDAVAVGGRVSGVLGDQLVAGGAPQIRVQVLLDLHRHLEVAAGYADVGTLVIGVRSLGLGVDFGVGGDGGPEAACPGMGSQVSDRPGVRGNRHSSTGAKHCRGGCCPRAL